MRLPETRADRRYSPTWPGKPIKLTRFAAQTSRVGLKGYYVSTLNPLDPGIIVRLQIHWLIETVEV